MKSSRLCYFVMFVLLWGLAGQIGWIFLWQPYWKSREIQDHWQPVTATVLSHRHDSIGFATRRGGLNRVQVSAIRYEYTFADRKYQSDNVYLKQMNLIYSMQKVFPGATIRCYVNPAQPEEAIISPFFRLNWLFGGLCAFLLLTGVAALWNAVRRTSGESAPAPLPVSAAAPPQVTFQGFPLCPEGKPTRSLELHRFDQRLEYRARTLYHLIVFLFFMVGVAIVAVGFFFPARMLWYAVIGGFDLLCTMPCWIKMSRTRLVFDLGMGAFWRDRRHPELVADPSTRHGFLPLNQVAALQVLCSTIDQSGSTPYVCYEMNLVLHSGERVHLLAHPNREVMLHDARIIADTLRVPIVAA